MQSVVSHLAPAKLNLALAIGPPDSDAGGMHPICSWMVTVDLCDELRVSRLPTGSLSRYAIIWHRHALRRSEIKWSVTKDLAVQAHLALEKKTGRDLPLQMKLEKKIPVGGGLGGGSSNAAAMLRAVNELYELGLSLDELAVIGAELGSDVPFLVHGGSAIVGGLGDEITKHDVAPDLNVVLAFPDCSCPTGRVYGLFDELIKGKNHTLNHEAVNALAGAGDHAPDPKAPFNDLAAPAILAAPDLEGLLERIGALAERPAHISGSGSSLFVICDDPVHAEALAEAVTRQLGIPAVAVSAQVSSESVII